MAQMSKADKELLDEIKVLESQYFTFDEPVPFCGLKIYPVTVRDYEMFLRCNDCFLLNKNDDPAGITKSHLDYLLSRIPGSQEGSVLGIKFLRMLELIFRVKNGFRCPKCGKFYDFSEIEKLESIPNTQAHVCECGEPVGMASTGTIKIVSDEKTKRAKIVVEGHDITAKDFNKLRRIPLYQNLPDYHDDSWVHPEVREDQRKKQELLAKKGADVKATLERKIICTAAKSSYKINELYDMPMRKFIMLLSVIDDAIAYETSRIGLMTGMVSSKKPLEHWVYKKDKGMYGEAVDADSFIQQIQNA